MSNRRLRIGVLAIQGDFEAHRRMLAGLGAEPVDLREPSQLQGLDGLVIPGGESTTISKGMARDGLDQAVKELDAAGKPILGSCAGMIVCDRKHLGIGDYVCRRNAFGRQLHSFEQDLVLEGLGEEPLRGVFIRAPWVEEHGPGVQVLAAVEGHPVAVRDGNLLAVAFHAELTDDSRLHALFMALATRRRGEDEGSPAEDQGSHVARAHTRDVRNGVSTSRGGDGGVSTSQDDGEAK